MPLVEFQANGHRTSGYLALPERPGPGLLVLQEWWGLVDHIKELADRFAAAGFVALAPDLYHGERATSPDAAGKMLMALDIERAGADLKGAAEYLRARPEVQPKRVGALGFCMGGQLALYAGSAHPEAIDAVVDFYGVHPKVTVDPSRLRAPVLAHFGKLDKSVPEADARALMVRLRAEGTQVEDHYYDSGHAFFNDTRPQVYDAASASLAWDRTLDFLRRTLA
jgi:carboxymethylenebutenolidase